LPAGSGSEGELYQGIVDESFASGNEGGVQLYLDAENSTLVRLGVLSAIVAVCNSDSIRSSNIAASNPSDSRLLYFAKGMRI